MVWKILRRLLPTRCVASIKKFYRIIWNDNKWSMIIDQWHRTDEKISYFLVHFHERKNSGKTRILFLRKYVNISWTLHPMTKMVETTFVENYIFYNFYSTLFLIWIIFIGLQRINVNYFHCLMNRLSFQKTIDTYKSLTRCNSRNMKYTKKSLRIRIINNSIFYKIDYNHFHRRIYRLRDICRNGVLQDGGLSIILLACPTCINTQRTIVDNFFPFFC